MAILYLESYYGGSHRQMVDLLQSEFGGDLFTLPPSKWNWRMRLSALHFSQVIPTDKIYNVVFASSVVNLCELVALRPDLRTSSKVYYFHENQLVYPVRKQQDRDFQHGYSQILSCLVADRVVFNSYYNMNSFLDSIQLFMSIIPDYKPKMLRENIAPKCSVLYFPVQKLQSSLKCTNAKEDAMDYSQLPLEKNTENSHSFDYSTDSKENPQSERKLHIVWPHRWEHDKGPEEFCSVLMRLINADLPFQVSILGSHSNDIPECLQKIIPLLGSRLLHKDHLSQPAYVEVLRSADVVVSTAKHEFFGVAMLEAVSCGCYPLCPNRLVYPEIYPSECLYNTEQQLFKRLKHFCQHPASARSSNISLQMSEERFSWTLLKNSYEELLQAV